MLVTLPCCVFDYAVEKIFLILRNKISFLGSAQLEGQQSDAWFLDQFTVYAISS